MVNISTNNNKNDYQILPYLNKHNRDHDIWRQNVLSVY